MFWLFRALETNLNSVKVWRVYVPLPEDTNYRVPSFSCCLTVLDCSLNCCYNSDQHARMHAQTRIHCFVALSSIIHCLQRHRGLKVPSLPRFFFIFTFFCRCYSKRDLGNNMVEVKLCFHARFSLRYNMHAYKRRKKTTNSFVFPFLLYSLISSSLPSFSSFFLLFVLSYVSLICNPLQFRPTNHLF